MFLPRHFSSTSSTRWAIRNTIKDHPLYKPAATQDENFRSFDKRNGDLLWQTDLLTNLSSILKYQRNILGCPKRASSRAPPTGSPREMQDLPSLQRQEMPDRGPA